MEELIDVLDTNGVKTGIIKKKSEIKKAGYFHLACSICIVNNNFNILMQKRDSKKTIYPSLWSIFVNGHVKSGETSIEASIREIKEELGIDIKKSDLKFLYSLKNEDASNPNYINNVFYDNYIAFLDIKLEDIIMQDTEVSEVKYLNYKAVKKMIEDKDKTICPNWKAYDRIMEYLEEKFYE